MLILHSLHNRNEKCRLVSADIECVKNLLFCFLVELRAGNEKIKAAVVENSLDML